MNRIPRKFRWAIAGFLLAFTAFAAGLTMSVVLNANAGNPGSAGVVASQPEAPSPTSTPEVKSGSSSESDNGRDYGNGFMQVISQFLDSNGSSSQSILAKLSNLFQGNGSDLQNFVQSFAGKLGLDSGPVTGGEISKIEGGKLTLKSGRVVTTTADTTFGDANATLNLSHFKVGDLVFVLGKAETDKSLTARWVLRLPPLPGLQHGPITSINAGSNQLKFTSGKDEWTATLNDRTEITKNGKKVTLADLAVKDEISVLGQIDKTAKTVAASRVVVGSINLRRPGGTVPSGSTVKSIDVAGNSLVVTTSENGTDKDVTVKVDKNTRFAGKDLKMLSDLKAGDKIFVLGDKQSDGSLHAKLISQTPFGPGAGGFPPGPRGKDGVQGKDGQGSSNPKPTPTPGTSN